MKSLPHTSAKPSHYDESAEVYDIFNEKKSYLINQTIKNILKKHHVKTVLDLTCGTGSQVLHLAKNGYKVTGSDISEKMLQIAREKALQENLNVQFIKGDMRTIQAGQFDAAITIFNAVGHLTKSDFENALQNIRNNLKYGDYIYLINLT